MGKNLEKWCTLERAKNNKIYPNGTIYTALSASDGIAYQLREDGYISDRYAVFIPKTKYINVFMRFFAKVLSRFIKSIIKALTLLLIILSFLIFKKLH